MVHNAADPSPQQAAQGNAYIYKCLCAHGAYCNTKTSPDGLIE